VHERLDRRRVGAGVRPVGCGDRVVRSGRRRVAVVLDRRVDVVAALVRRVLELTPGRFRGVGEVGFLPPGDLDLRELGRVGGRLVCGIPAATTVLVIVAAARGQRERDR
jgi:hypothetical protein